MKESIKQYLQDIIISIEKIERYTQQMTFQEYIADEKTMDSVERNIITIGEATNRIPKEFQEKYPSVPWRNMKDIRNVITHEYNGIDYETVWNTIKKDLPSVKVKIKEVFQDGKLWEKPIKEVFEEME